jgi:membrane fusion protein
VHGDVILIQPVTTRLIVGLFVASVSCGLAFAASAEYTKKETVTGYLAPSGGFASVQAPRGGVIFKVNVEEGQLVKAGDALLTLKTDESLENGPWVSQQIKEALQQRRSDLKLQMSLVEGRMAGQEGIYRRRMAVLQQQERQLLSSLNTQATSSALALQEVEANQNLLRKGFSTDREVGRKQREYLAQIDARTEVEQRLAKVRGDLEELDIQVNQLPAERNERMAELSSRIAELDQQLVETSRSEAYVLRAPISGRISGLQATVGRSPPADEQLLSIIPEHAELEAYILVPTRSAGFIKVGQHVKLMYDAFPYQRFGLYHARISAVTNNALTPNQLTGPARVEEPVYHVKARLASQTVNAYGNPMLLRPGMSFKADVLLEERSLLEWMLNPLYSLRGRV